MVRLDPKKTAFVAMKFHATFNRDKRYRVIKECLQEAGYDVTRADEIRTSGPSADEVCNLLRDSTLVVVDTSGDSHNVSYELGYCHGVGRTPASTLLLRELSGSAAPFNYRHFRYRTYKDLQELRQVVRDWFGISAPMTNEQLGYVFNFTVTSSGTYGSEAAAAVINVLGQVKFTGRCEYYAADGYALGMPDAYLIALGLKPLRQSQQLSNAWWKAFTAKVATNLREGDRGLVFAPGLSEITSIGQIRACMMPRGAVEFTNGMPKMILHEDSWDSWFIGQIQEQLRVPNIAQSPSGE